MRLLRKSGKTQRGAIGLPFDPVCSSPPSRSGLGAAAQMAGSGATNSRKTQSGAIGDAPLALL